MLNAPLGINGLSMIDMYHRSEIQESIPVRINVPVYCGFNNWFIYVSFFADCVSLGVHLLIVYSLAAICIVSKTFFV